MASNRTDAQFLIAAIDIGTSYSGYAFSFRSDFLKDQTIINTNQWQALNACLQSHKAPSTVLFDKDMNFHSFGFEAEDKFAKLAEEKKNHEWFYFKDFKMSLLEKASGLKVYT